MGDASVTLLSPRASASYVWAPQSGTAEFIDLISNPFASQVSQTSIVASVSFTFLLTALAALCFCVIRPHLPPIYAPRLKAADEKHAPQPIGRGLLAWINPIRTTAEVQMIEKIGLDATLFLRFTRMCRNIFLALSLLGCLILIPINIVGNHNSFISSDQLSTLVRVSPQYTTGGYLWAYVVCVYIFDIIICYFLWLNYRVVVRLRKAYFESDTYRSSLHARTIMLTDIPKTHRTDDGVVRIAEEAKATEHVPRAAIARNVRDLPDLVEDYEDAVKEFESVLAKYFKNPDQISAKRPTCKPSKKDRAHHQSRDVDAIDYYTARIQELEKEITQVRQSIDNRNPMSYGFATYPDIEDAHSVAFAARKRKIQETTIKLAPKPTDLIWKNLGLSKIEKGAKERINFFWILALTILYVPFNALSAVFLSNLSHLGLVWPAFQQSLYAHKTGWAIVQGVLSPAIQSGIYLGLPVVFRRLRIKAGDTTKSQRERHVTNKLYGFFVFNNLIVFSVFSTAFSFVAALINTKEDGWQAVQDAHLSSTLLAGLLSVAPFWVTWLLQRSLGASADLLQIWPLIWKTWARKFSSPTPRQLIELSAPPTFEYAEYYNYFLFYVTVTLCFATLQPLVLPVTAFYFCIDSWLKKYLLLYVLITKNESGGSFWRLLVNRILFATILSNFVVALLVAVQGFTWVYAVCIIPSPLLLIGFKYYCTRTFDDKLKYYLPRNFGDAGVEEAIKSSARRDRVAVRFGNPAVYQKLITPMVNANARDLLRSIYRGRLDDDMAQRPISVAGYSDIYMTNMSPDRVGQRKASAAPFEFVAEGEMDFENFKKRPEFRDQFGGDGELYGRAQDSVDSRPGTPSSMNTLNHFKARAESVDSSRHSSRTRFDPNFGSQDGAGTVYPAGYHQAPMPAYRESSPGRDGWGSRDITAQGPYPDESRGRLTRGAAPMGRSYSPMIAPSPGQTPGVATDGPGMMFQRDVPDEDTSYDYYRRGRPS